MGRLNRAVLKRLPTDGTQRSAGCILWDLAEAGGHIEASADGLTDTIKQTFYSKFRRSLSSLIARAAREPEIGLLVERRKLGRVRDVVSFYPQKSLTVQVRQLRQQLWPVLVEILRDSRRPQYGAHEREPHILAGLKPDDLERHRDKWREFRSELIHLMPTLEVDHQERVIRLLARGAEIWQQDRAISVSRSLVTLVEDLPDIPARASLMTWLDTALPHEARRHIALKSFMHAISSFTQDVKRPGLKDEFKDRLFQHAPEIVGSLPGHDEPEKSWYGRAYSPLLDKLVDRHLFCEFELLSRCRPKASIA